MRVAFLYNEPSEDPAHIAEEEDAIHSPVVAALRRLGHAVTPIACTLDLAAVRRRLERAKPDVVFNRVESLGGSDAMMAAVTLVLDVLQIPYTGCPTQALVVAANKLAVKQRLVRAGLPTPAWITADAVSCRHTSKPQSETGNPQYILKSVLEHASFQMDDASLLHACSPREVSRLVRQREAETGRPYFAEEFVDGREFNLSLWGDGPQVLPHAEIDFSAFSPGKPRIVSHGAKWDSGSFEFQNTPRRFIYPASDEPLLHRLSEFALECWRLFGLAGYARIDFRCDSENNPWILEVNTNPSISPEAGFAAALEEAGIGYDGGIQRILDDAIAGTIGRVPLAPPVTLLQQ